MKKPQVMKTRDKALCGARELGDAQPPAVLFPRSINNLTSAVFFCIFKAANESRRRR